MMNTLRITAAVAALALSATPTMAAPVVPDKQATATARIVKPLSLAWVQDLDFGTVTLVDQGPATVTVALDGSRSCPNAAVTCSGASTAAKYKITGTNNQTVTVNSSNVSMTGPAGSTPLLLTVNAPASVPLGNSGSSGTEFAIGGSISVAGSQAEGTYIGTFAVTVNY